MVFITRKRAWRIVGALALFGFVCGMYLCFFRKPQAATQDGLQPIGCFADAQDHDLPVSMGIGSLEDCSLKCKGYNYFGRQGAGECWCGDTYGRYGESSGCDCNSNTNIGTSKQCVYPLATPCLNGVTIPNSNRTNSAPCQGLNGEECAYECDAGYLKIGRHVCQTYSISGKNVIDHAFFGGRCDKLCSSAPCETEYMKTDRQRYCPIASDISTEADCRAAALKLGLTFEGAWLGVGGHRHCLHADDGRSRVYFNTASALESAQTPPSTKYSSICLAKVPIRINATENGEACLQTTCLEPEAAFLQLARGAYELFQRGRNPKTGIYIDHVDVKAPADQQHFEFASMDATAVGMAVECVAANLGIISVQEAEEKILTTMRALTGRISGFKVPRNPRGFLPTFVNSDTGVPADGSFSTDSTGMIGVGHLFAKTCLETTDAGSASLQEIRALSAELHAAVQYETLLCDNGNVTGEGKDIPFLLDDANGCSDVISPAPDGYFYYDEMIWIAYLAFHQACGNQPVGQCSNKPIEQMWAAWQGRRNHPWYYYGGQGVLTIWPSFLLQLPFYLVHAFNSDPVYTDLFQRQWQAEWDYYRSDVMHAGEDGRYGVAAGPTIEWCAGTTYSADMIANFSDGSQQHCRMYSPYAVAGYLPASPSVIQGHLLALLSSGEAVYPLVNSDLFVLWRKSLLDPSWSQPDWGITLVDFASEFYGLSTIWLGADFFKRNTNFWSDDVNATNSKASHAKTTTSERKKVEYV